MRFKTISQADADKQSASLGLWPAGDYDFEVRDASEQTSEAGNEMIKLEVWVYNSEGSRRLVFDYLVASEKSAWKIRHFADACGMSRQYETGTLMVAEIVGRTGRCTIGVQPAKNGYEAKNVLRDYLKASGEKRSLRRTLTSTTNAAVPADLDDEIPF